MVLPLGGALFGGMAFVFEDLRVYRRAEECLTLAYETAAMLPSAERFNLSEQLRRASVSVVLNIAESTERRTGRDAARFIQFALGSLVEVIACLRIINHNASAVPPNSSPPPETSTKTFTANYTPTATLSGPDPKAPPALCPVPCALCPVPCALCPVPCVLCSVFCVSAIAAP